MPEHLDGPEAPFSACAQERSVVAQHATVTVPPMRTHHRWSPSAPTAPVVRSAPRALTIMGVLALVVLAACGGSGDDGGAAVASLATAAPDTSTGGDDGGGDGGDGEPLDPEEAILAYSRCMREHGVDLPDPQVDAAGGGGGMIVLDEQVDPDDGTFQEAQEACGSIMEDAAGAIEVDPEQEAEMREQMLAFAACMREHGVDFPDPTFDGNGRVTVGLGADGPSDVQDDEWQAASEACAQEGGGAPFQVSSRPVGGDD